MKKNFETLHQNFVLYFLINFNLETSKTLFLLEKLKNKKNYNKMIRVGRSLFNKPLTSLVKQNNQVVDILSSRNNSTLAKGLLNLRTPSYYQVRNKA